MKHYPQSDGPARDFGTAERHAQSPVIEIALESERLKVAKALIECVLDRYQQRAQVSDRQHQAGMKLRELWHSAVLPASTTSCWGPPSGGGGDMADRTDARRKLAEAMLGAYVKTTGEHLAQRSPISGKWMLVLTRNGEQHFPEAMPWRLLPIGHTVVAVCGFDEWAGGTERLMSLREGLTALANHWGLAY